MAVVEGWGQASELHANTPVPGAKRMGSPILPVPYDSRECVGIRGEGEGYTLCRAGLLN